MGSNTEALELSEVDLRKLFPNARSDYVKAILHGEPLLRRFGILANSDRWCAWIANVGAETGGLTVVRENMNYTANNLLRVWPSRYPNTASGRALAKSHAKKGGRFVANYNYGFRLGNRGRNTDDGWNYRGALLLQHTGRNMARWLQETTGQPWADDPSLFDDVSLCVEPACLVWTAQDGIGDLNKYADEGNFKACCNGINRGNPRSQLKPIGWDHRQNWHRKAVKLWGDRKPVPYAPISRDVPPETVDVPLPEPAPPAKDVLPKASRKWNLLNWLRGLFGIGAGGTATYSVVDSINTAQSVMGPLKAFATEWGVPVLIIVCVGGFVLVELVKYLMAEDFEDGRYQPSKGAQ